MRRRMLFWSKKGHSHLKTLALSVTKNLDTYVTGICLFKGLGRFGCLLKVTIGRS